VGKPLGVRLPPVACLKSGCPGSWHATLVRAARGLQARRRRSGSWARWTRPRRSTWNGSGPTGSTAHRTLFRKYHDQAFSFTDCASVAVFETLAGDSSEAVTYLGFSGTLAARRSDRGARLESLLTRKATG
jgi:hypothetical protein